jgi:uncharacterized repeat protein (TIGR04076 family)
MTGKRKDAMFKVKVTVIDFLGDKEKYPCHHRYKLGDEFIFDGESFTGTLCPSLIPLVMPKILELHAAGPRYRDLMFYYPFLYSPVSAEDPEMKKYDGIGYRNVLETYSEQKYHMANLASAGFKWPPPEEQVIKKDVTMICPDYRTSVKVKIEAFDISDKGRNIPYFRRQMVIVDRVSKKPGIKTDKIMGEFTRKERDSIYPALSKVNVKLLVEELELTGYLKISKEAATVTAKGKKKLAEFKAGLSKDEIKALGI